MAFEVFLGPRSLGTIAREAEGWIVLAIRDPEERLFILRALGGPPSQRERDRIRFKPADLSPEAFEAKVVALRHDRGYTIVPRSWSPP